MMTPKTRDSQKKEARARRLILPDSRALYQACALALALAPLACAPAAGDGGTGGATASGGTTSSGGSSNAGGSSTSGGASSAGGASGGHPNLGVGGSPTGGSDGGDSGGAIGSGGDGSGGSGSGGTFELPKFVGNIT